MASTGGLGQAGVCLGVQFLNKQNDPNINGEAMASNLLAMAASTILGVLYTCFVLAVCATSMGTFNWSLPVWFFVRRYSNSHANSVAMP